MAEYLKRALGDLQPLPFEPRAGLARTMAARQGRGDVISALSGGALGAELQGGPDPREYLMGEIAGDRKLALTRAKLEREAQRDQMSDAQWLADYQQKDELARLAANAKGQRKPSAKEMQNMVANTEALGRLDQLSSQIAGLDPQARSDLDSPWYEIATNTLLPASLKRRADEGYYAPEAEDILRAGEIFNSNIRRAFAGTAVTKYEGEDTDKWSPMAPGLSLDQRQRRMQNIRQDLLSTRQIYGEVYPDALPEYEGGASQAAPVGNSGKYTIISVEG